jgi:outer membrane protein
VGLSLASCALGIASCATDQQKEISQYRDALTLGEVPEFKGGDPLSLQTAVLLTNATNEELSIEGENYLQAIIDRERSVAAFLPTLDLLPTYVFRDSTSTTAPGLSDRTVFDAPLSGQMSLFEGFRNQNQLKASDLTIEQRLWLLLDLRESLLLDMAQVYYRVLRAEHLVVVLENSVAAQQDRVRDMQSRQRVGVARPLDVAQTEAQLSQTRVSLLNAKNAVVTNRAALAFLTGAEVKASPLTDEFPLPTEPRTLDDLMALASSLRQDLAAAATSAEVARREVDIAIGQYAPSVRVELDYFLTRDSLPDDRDWTGILFANIPIFSGGRIAADVSQAWSRFRQEVMSYSLIRRRIRQDVEVALQNVQSSVLRMAELREQLRAAQEALRQAESAYTNGLGTNLERVAAQDQLLNAELLLTSEESELKVFYLSAYRAVGAITAGTSGRELPPTPARRPVPESPFVTLPE